MDPRDAARLLSTTAPSLLAAGAILYRATASDPATGLNEGDQLASLWQDGMIVLQRVPSLTDFARWAALGIIEPVRPEEEVMPPPGPMPRPLHLVRGAARPVRRSRRGKAY